MRKHPKGYEHVRTARFAPYRKGCGPTFRLELYDTRELCHGSPHWRLAYRFFQVTGRINELIFEGEDYGCSPCDAIDSDASVASLMTFLTLRPGDTDDEYFEKYTERQLRFADEHAEALSCLCIDRYEKEGK